MATLLEREMDYYEANIERRRRKLLEAAETNVPAVRGFMKTPAVRKVSEMQLLSLFGFHVYIFSASGNKVLKKYFTRK
jgi:hypothetical protein